MPIPFRQILALTSRVARFPNLGNIDEIRLPGYNKPNGVQATNKDNRPAPAKVFDAMLPGRKA
jgi:hypothetical protein